MGKWQTNRRHHKREPRGQPFPSRWPRSTYKQTHTGHSKHKTEEKHKRSTKSFTTSQLRLLAEVWCRNEHANAMWAVFWIDEVCYRYNAFDGQMTHQDVLDLNWHNVEDDTCIVLHVKHACELIFKLSIVVKCIYTDVPTILLFHTNNKEGVGRSKAVVLLLLIRCWLLLKLKCSVNVPCFVVHGYVSFLVLQSSWWGRESWLLYFVCLSDVLWFLCSSPSRCRALVFSVWLWYFLIILTYFFHTNSFFKDSAKEWDKGYYAISRT